jgi:predicted kinase
MSFPPPNLFVACGPAHGSHLIETKPDSRGTKRLLAATSLTAGQSVILDGVFAREEERDAVRAIATAAGVDFRGFWLQAPVSVLEGRIQGRHGDASDADLAVLHKQLFYDVGRVDWHPIDANDELGVIANNIMRQIVITRGA